MYTAKSKVNREKDATGQLPLSNMEHMHKPVINQRQTLESERPFVAAAISKRNTKRSVVVTQGAITASFGSHETSVLSNWFNAGDMKKVYVVLENVSIALRKGSKAGSFLLEDLCLKYRKPAQE